MIYKRSDRAVARRLRAFTLIELLVVISIIALLVSILVPSLSGARKSAKDAKTRAMLKSIAESLELFKQDNEKQYRQTNGYPASHRAEDPAYKGAQDIMGAQWLVRSLVGKDLQGFIPRRIVPLELQDRSDKTEEQFDWYPDPSKPNDPPPIDPVNRIAPYISLQRVTIVDEARKLSPVPPDENLWKWCVENCGNRIADSQNPPKLAPVFVDAFGFPILYYAADAYGRALCVKETGDLYKDKLKGYYTQQDNDGFTGNSTNINKHGWLFRQGRRHPLEVFGPDDFQNLHQKEWAHSFANYIHDHRIDAQTNGVYKPFNVNRYLLITAGQDAMYGTVDDINNFRR